MNENKTTYSGSDVLALFSKLEKRLESLTCFVRDCCAKVPINIGRGLGLYRRLSSGKWQFKTLLAGDNITLIETTEEIVISASSSTPSCQDINNCLGISESGSDNKFLNEQGDFITISSSRFTCSDLDNCSTSNLQEGSRLYFTDNRAISALTGQNISLFTNNVGYLTSSSLTPYLTISSASSTYYPLSNPSNFISSITNLDVITALGYTPYDSTNPNNYITSSALSPYLLTSTAASTYQPIGSYLTTISGLNISLLNNDSNYLTSSTASSTYEPIITPGTTSQYYRGDKTFQTLDKSTIGLGNVDNTSDSNKPISTATQNALDLKANKTEVIPLIAKISTTYTVTGATTETAFTFLKIPANTFTTGDRVILDAMFLKSGGAGTTTSSFRISTSSSVSPITNATLIAKTPAAVAATTYYPLERKYIKIDSATSTIMPPASSGAYNDLTSFNSLPFTSLNIDWTVDQYVYPTETLGNSADAVTLKYFAIYKG